MQLGWVSPEGTNSFSTASTIGTSIVIRPPIFKKFIERGDTVFWFGLKQGSHLFEGEDVGLVPIYEIKEVVNSHLREAQKEWEFGEVNNPNNYSMSKWRTTKAIRGTLKHMRRNMNMPELDVLFAEYMDNGMTQIVFFTCIILYYAQKDTVLYVRDTENKFRYVSEYKIKSDEPRDNMYSHRLGRYVRGRDIETLRGKIRMCYAFKAPWDDGTDGFYRIDHGGPLYFPMVYDPERELPLKFKNKHTPVVYIGNDNNRRPMFEEYYGNIRYNAQIYGNWIRRATNFSDEIRKRNKRVYFNPPIAQTEMLPELSRAYSTVFVTKKIYQQCGQVTTRSVEVSLAGTIAIVPDVLPEWDTWALEDFVVSGPSEMNRAIEHVMSLKKNQYRDAIMDQREVVSESFHVDKMFDVLLDQFEIDGVMI